MVVIISYLKRDMKGRFNSSFGKKYAADRKTGHLSSLFIIILVALEKFLKSHGPVQQIFLVDKRVIVIWSFFRDYIHYFQNFVVSNKAPSSNSPIYMLIKG